LLFALIGISLNKLTYPMSKALINNMLFFLTLSFTFLERLSQGMAIRQFVFAIVSLIISIIVIMILRQIERIESFMYVFAAIGIILLLIVSLAGKVEYGAKLSLSFGNISIQPSEFVKLSFLFFISGCIVTYKDFRGFLFASIGAGSHVIILVLSKD